MGLNVKINLENCYDIIESREDLKLHRFNTVLKDGQIKTLGVSIGETAHPLLPDVYNLAFGPIDDNNTINDKIEIPHENLSKMFSTIILIALTFLAENPDSYLGIDGSNNARAYMYYRCINNNFDYLSDFFKLFGVKYYVRILRKKNDDDQHYTADTEDTIAIPNEIKKGVVIRSDQLYNYFIFKLNR
jgi:hypothetical protein